MKNKKLSLNELKVKSFVTEFESEKEMTLKGGNSAYLPGMCGDLSFVSRHPNACGDTGNNESLVTECKGCKVYN